MSTYRYPIAVQIVLPEQYQEQEDFAMLLKKLKGQGFTGLELNMRNPADVSIDELSSFLDQFGLHMTMFASGLTAKTHGLSLSHEQHEQRERAVSLLLDMIDKLADRNIGIIVGFLKGPVSSDPVGARDRNKESLAKVAPAAEDADVQVLLEATNRYESSVANSLQDAADIIDHVGSEALKMLPDTFHMNIEERNMFDALSTYRGYYSSIHLSDNNRFLPGHGALDFEKIIRYLDETSYQGGLALEGNTLVSLEDDLVKAMGYLAPMILK